MEIQPAVGETIRLADQPQTSEIEPDSAPERGPRPFIPWYGNIQQYADSDLLSLLSWICSDGRLRTDEELIAEMMGELGFRRRGARIEARLRQILTLERSKRQKK